MVTHTFLSNGNRFRGTFSEKEAKLMKVKAKGEGILTIIKFEGVDEGEVRIIEN